MVSTIRSFDLDDDERSKKAISQTATDAEVELYGADEETLIHLLSSKIKYALAGAGYDQTAQAVVSRLVERNVVSCGVALRGSGGTATMRDGHTLDEVGGLVRSQVEDLMARGFQVNSNEPVLLVLVGHQEGRGGHVPVPVVGVVDAIKEASCAVLGSRFGIFPVRVYVAVHHDGEGSGVRDSGPGFSLALLNVCNTDIGGPGMIQLLDSEATSLDWKRMVVISEAWDRTQLYWRKEDERLNLEGVSVL